MNQRVNPGTSIARCFDRGVAGVNVFAIVGAFLVFISPSPTGGREIANIRVTPATSFAPANVSVEVAVERHRDNRKLALTVHSGRFYWSSQRQLAGGDGPYVSIFLCRELPAGEYDVQASVLGDARKVRGTVSTHIVVAPRASAP